jgi:hypothetical protein
MNPTPDIWIQADDLSKIFLSTMWTDVAQVSTTPNILSNPNLLQHFSQHSFKILFFDERPDGN